MSVGLYSFTETISNHITRISDIRSKDPSLARQMVDFGESLVLIAKCGSLRKLVVFSSSIRHEDLIYLYVMQAFNICLIQGHLIMADHFISNGFSINDPTVPHILVHCLREVVDYAGVDITNFLVSKGYDVNLQVCCCFRNLTSFT